MVNPLPDTRRAMHDQGYEHVRPMRLTFWNGSDPFAVARKILLPRSTPFHDIIAKAASACKVQPHPRLVFEVDGSPVRSEKQLEEGRDYLIFPRGGRPVDFPLPRQLLEQQYHGKVVDTHVEARQAGRLDRVRPWKVASQKATRKQPVVAAEDMEENTKPTGMQLVIDDIAKFRFTQTTLRRGFPSELRVGPSSLPSSRPQTPPRAPPELQAQPQRPHTAPPKGPTLFERGKVWQRGVAPAVRMHRVKPPRLPNVPNNMAHGMLSADAPFFSTPRTLPRNLEPVGEGTPSTTAHNTPHKLPCAVKAASTSSIPEEILPRREDSSSVGGSSTLMHRDEFSHGYTESTGGHVESSKRPGWLAISRLATTAHRLRAVARRQRNRARQRRERQVLQTTVHFPIALVRNADNPTDQPVRVEGGSVAEGTLATTNTGKLYKIEWITDDAIHAREVLRQSDIGLSGSLGGRQLPPTMSFLTDNCCTLAHGQVRPTSSIIFLFWVDLENMVIEPCASHEVQSGDVVQCPACGAVKPEEKNIHLHAARSAAFVAALCAICSTTPHDKYELCLDGADLFRSLQRKHWKSRAPARSADSTYKEVVVF